MHNIKHVIGLGLHYNFVTDAWRFILGTNFHYGYFRSAHMSLSEATNALTDELTKLVNITENSKILDVGCGIGGPAFYLHEKYNCFIIGITNSEKGVKLAKKENELRGYSQKVQFQLVDVLNNKFPDSSFDVVWVMESSHLMKRKEKLFSESYRLLKNNGTVVLCDVILKRNLSEQEVVKYNREINILLKTFGKVEIATLKYYLKGLQAVGFSKVMTRNISKNVFPTMEHWRKNITHNRNKILQSFSKRRIDEFLLACDILEASFRDNIIGYGLVKAVK